MNNKIVIFVGADNSGKTTIAKALKDHTGYQYFKNPIEHQRFISGESFFKRELEHSGPLTLEIIRQCKFDGGGIILDRYTPCEWVYSKVYSRYTNDSVIWDIDSKLCDMNAIIIYCYKTEYSNYSDEIIEESKIPFINKYYMDYLNISKCKSLQLDTTDQDLNSQISKIMKAINEN